jgi:uncharacterized protein YegJ (DUF2314 family)
MTEELFLSPSVDSEMDEASINARKSFKIFWRELSWEMRRIVPGHAINAVKRGFPTNKNQESNLSIEHMWVRDIEFDGQLLTGQLLNQPNEMEDLNQGDIVQFHYGEISDWMYLMDGEVYGAFTVNLLRSRMTNQELKQHDDAWRMDFGDPNDIYIAPMLSLSDFLLTPSIEVAEHQMSQNMADKSEEGIRGMGQQINDLSIFGMTMLQFESLAGNLAQVKILIKYGADQKIKNVNGQTAKDLAEMFNWIEILAVLK